MKREKYESMTDEELITLFRDGDQDAMEQIQEGMLGLFKAVRDYDCGRDASFSTFAQLCVTRQLYTAVKASARKKHLPLNTAVSLSRPLRESGEGEDEEFMDCLEADASSNPEEYIIGQEEMERLEEKIERELSAFEKQVLELYLTGMGYVEIAHVLNRDEKSTDNALQRIRTKLKKRR